MALGIKAILRGVKAKENERCNREQESSPEQPEMLLTVRRGCRGSLHSQLLPKRAFHFRLVQNHQGPNANGQAGEAATTGETRDHNQNTSGYAEAIALKFFHFKTADYDQ